MVLRVFPPKVSWDGVNDAALARGLFLGVSSPQGSWGSRCCHARQRIVPWGFVPQGKMGRPMLPRSPENCASGFRPPREAGAASTTPRLPSDEALLFVPGVLSPRGSSLSFLRVSSPKGSWGGVNDAALASGCWTAVARRWAIGLIVADNAVRPMEANAAPGLYTLLPARRRRAGVSDLY